MPATTPPRSPSPSPELDQVQSSLPSAQPELKTPERKRGATRLVPGITPLSRGSAVRQKQEGDTDRVYGYDRGDYDKYVCEDIKNRVFVDFEVFMKYVLHVPDDWKTRWSPVIEAVKGDSVLKEHHEQYCKLCDDAASREKWFYKPLMETANAVLGVLSQPEFEGISCGIPQYYHVNDPNKLQGGVINKTGLSPDLVVLHTLCNETENLHWANALHVLEVKPFDSAICDGENMPRLVVNDVDPILNHAPPHRPLRYGGKKSTSHVTSTIGSSSGSASSSKSKKRPADESSTTDQRPNKRSRSNPLLGKDTSAQITEGDESCSAAKPETQRQIEPALQICRYLLEMFSVPLLRSHATTSLVDRDRLQLYYSDHSVILVSSAINFSKDDGLDKFIANIIAFHCLSFEENGILDTLTSKNINLICNPNIPKDDRVVQHGNELRFSGEKPGDCFTVVLDDVISRDPATIGRSTAVLNATCSKWEDTELVIKVSWPSSNRVSETEFLKKANEEAEKTDGKWATKHLPRVLYSKDVVFGQDSTLNSVARLFDNAKFVNKEYKYERRTLRVIIQERLYPLKMLTDVGEIGQVFVDVACIHRWLHDKPGILHRDLSFNNIMCRILKRKNTKGEAVYEIYGVLTDYDLSSWTAALVNGYTKTSQQRTGTPPYMAQELLLGTCDTHMYRHDVESFFYILLMMCTRHTIGNPEKGEKPGVIMRKGELPYQEWFNQYNYKALGNDKYVFFLTRPAIEVSPAFEGFREWLRALRYSFFKGFKSKLDHSSNEEELPEWMLDVAGESAGQVKPTPVPFDDETLGGHVNYSAVIEPARRLKVRLEGLDIPYDPKSSQLPTPTGAI